MLYPARVGTTTQNVNEDKAANDTKKRILFVDDDADTTVVIKLGLSHHRFEVEAFVDSKSALHNIKPSVYDLLLLDVLMKG